MFTAVLDAIRVGDLAADFEFVFINRERGQTAPTDSFIDLAEANEIPVATLSSRRFRREHNNAPWAELRTSFDRAVLSKLETFEPDVGVVAGYMLFAPEISRQMRILNQHPALPGGPIGKWQDVIWDVIQQGAGYHGSMVHIATPELDRGPVVSFCSFAVRGPSFDPLWDAAQNHDISALRDAGDESLPLFAAIREAGVIRERLLVVETLKGIADGQIDLDAVANGKTTEPVDMTERIDSALGRI